jgi:hypothetical protein
MITFKISFVENWKEKGYNYILIVPRQKYGVLRPLTSEKTIKKGYTIEIDELRLIHMEDDYFFVKKKDAAQIPLMSEVPLFRERLAS